MQNRIKVIEQEVKSMEEERLDSIDELNQIYAFHILHHCLINYRSSYQFNPNSFNFKVDSVTFNFEELNENIENISSMNDFQCQNLNWNNWSSYTLNDIEKQLNTKSSYKERLILINKKQKKETLALNEDISKLELEINQLDNLLLKDIIDNESFNSISTSSDLLWFCIKNGYIDETYQDYISYFFESSVTREDKNFARIVSSQNKPDFEIKLNYIDDLLNYYVDSEKLYSDSALNFSLLDYLLKSDNFKNHKFHLVKQLITGTPLVTNFIKQYFLRNKNLDLFIPTLSNQSKDCFDFLDNNEENIRTLIRYMPLSTLNEANNTKDNLDYFLDNRTDYISFVLDCFKDTDNAEFLYKKFTEVLNPKLHLLEIDKSNTQHLELFNWLGENDYLYTSYDVIHKIVYYNSENTEEEITDALAEKPLTTIMNSNIEYLKSYIQFSDEHIDKILKENPQNIFKEDKEVLIRFLNGSIHKPLKIRLIKKSETIIDNINEVEDTDLHETIFNSNNINPVWSNVIQIYKNNENEFPEYLINFINESYNELIKDKDFHKQRSESNHDLQEAFEASIIETDSLTDKGYENIIATLAFSWDDISINDISSNKVISLISSKKLSYSNNNWNNIVKLNNATLKKAFIKAHLWKLLTTWREDDLKLEMDDYEIILSIKLFKEHRQKFSEKYCGDLIQHSKNLTNLIIELFDDKKMPTNLYNQVLVYSNTEQKIKLLENQMKYMTPNAVFECINQMNEPLNQLALQQDKMIKFENNKQNQEFLQLLYDNELITKVDLKKEKRLGSKKFLFTRRRKDV